MLIKLITENYSWGFRRGAVCMAPAACVKLEFYAPLCRRKIQRFRSKNPEVFPSKRFLVI